MRPVRSSARSVGYLAMALGAWLWAVPGWAAGAKCQADCAGTYGGEIQQCLDKCPRARGNKKSQMAYQTCSERCTKRFQQAVTKCTKSCGPEENDPPPDIEKRGKKKKKRSSR